MKNPEDRKTLDRDMKSLIWQRDNRICKKCDRTLYRSRKPKGGVHHIDFDKKNNKASNLVLLCSSCHRALHNLYRKWRYKYMWEMQLITDTNCVPITEYDKEVYPSYCYHYTTERIDALERERGYLVLPQKDERYLELLKLLESQLIAEHRKVESLKAADSEAEEE